MAGLCFRITAVPFHFYAPDVFQGTTAANAAMLSLVPKDCGLRRPDEANTAHRSDRELTQWVPDYPAQWLLAGLAVATMFVGNLMALRQKHLYRLMAYSSIAHAGYMLIGLAIGDATPVGGREAISVLSRSVRPDDESASSRCSARLAARAAHSKPMVKSAG